MSPPVHQPCHAIGFKCWERTVKMARGGTFTASVTLDQVCSIYKETKRVSCPFCACANRSYQIEAGSRDSRYSTGKFAFSMLTAVQLSFPPMRAGIKSSTGNRLPDEVKTRGIRPQSSSVSQHWMGSHTYIELKARSIIRSQVWLRPYSSISSPITSLWIKHNLCRLCRTHGNKE